MINKTTFSILFLLISSTLLAQTKVEGYAFETGNRGFLKGINVMLEDLISGDSETAITDQNGKYEFSINHEHDYRVTLESDLFLKSEIEFKKDQIIEGETVFLSHELKREPGYIFEITLAEKNSEPGAPKDQMKGALVEVYNNTKEEVELVIENLTLPDFKVDLKKGNHYTILVRHPDFLTKRMEAFVDVEGCILCFEGIGDVRPGVSDNLTEGNTQGTLLANVELEKYFDGKVISLSNIYYDLGDFKITSEAAQELDKVAVFINDNPNIKIELSSHTDSRGYNDFNMKLSQQRSEAAVRYLLTNGNVNPNQMTAQGYGETKLLNKCRNGVKCTEDDHKVNRRTELKLLKIESTEKYKSLAAMKREEKFEKMLNELEFGGSQVRVSSEDELPVEEKKSEENLDFDGGEDTSSLGDDAIGEQSIDSEILTEEYEEMKSDFADYTGYKLVIHFSRFPLPKDHELFSQNEEVLDYVTKDANHLYMIGDFEKKKDALKHLKREVIEKYPNAYLVGFEDGIRVE